MIDLQWLSDRLCDVLRWHVANPGSADDPTAPEVPMAGQRVWGLFLSLHATRGGGMGPVPISHGEIEAFARREPIRQFEVEMIRAMDAAWLRAVALKREGVTGKPATTPASSRPLSPAVFDALFSKAG